MKNILKKTIIIWVIICMLLPTLFSGFAYALEPGKLNKERAGNYAANFAINFYDNWSSVSFVDDGSSRSIDVTGDFGWPLSNSDYYISGNVGDLGGGLWAPLGHNGLDLAPGDPNAQYEIYSVSEGTLVSCANDNGYNGGMGNNVVIETDDLTIRYLHLQEVSSEIMNRVGDTIQAGTYLGLMGSSGRVTGKHLHIDFQVSSETDAKKYTADFKDGTPYIPGGKGFFLNPLAFISPDNVASSSTKSKRRTTRGKIRTKYDESINPYDPINADSRKYLMNNKSWIGFVYRESLLRGNIYDVFSGAGNNLGINTANFDDRNTIPELKDIVNDNTTDILDISNLISEGRILPGDILVAEYPKVEYEVTSTGEQSTGTQSTQASGTNSSVNTTLKPKTTQYVKEYLLYVGGTKIMYATQDEKVAPSGAIKYEYLEYYLQRIRRNLKEGHEDDAKFVMPEYGITQIYRIKKEYAENIDEENVNLFFNGKGYYSKADYEGIPSDIQLFETQFSGFRWIFEKISQLVNLFINLIVYMIRMQIIGWANLFENLIQHVVLGLSGNNESAGWDAVFGTSATSASGERVTVESIFFNRIPILDANFFQTEEAGGRKLTKKVEINGPLQLGEERTQDVLDTDNIVYVLRKNLSTIYVVFRNISIALMLFILVGVGIKIAITSSASKKADYKKFITSWVFAFCVVLFVHLFMYTVFMINDYCVGVCNKWSQGAAQEEVSTIIQKTENQEEINLYDAVRIKAYAFNWKEGVPATIVYVYLIYLMIRFLLIYFKRYLTIYILALSGTFIGVKYAIDRLLGKKTNPVNKWAKDFAFNVLLQTVHAFIYVLFISIALSVSQKSIGGALIAVVILNFMLQADKIIIKIFGLDKAGSLADVNSPESWMQVFRKFLPMYTISKSAVNLSKGMLVGRNGILRRGVDIFIGADNPKDADKGFNKFKYGLIGHTIGRLPNNKYSLLRDKDLSYETKKKYYAEIKSAKKIKQQKFTRKFKTASDLAIGSFGTVASIAVAIADPSAGAAMFYKSRSKIKGYRSPRSERKVNRYYGSVGNARIKVQKADMKYNSALNTHTENEFNFQERYNSLIDDYHNATTQAQKDAIKAQMKVELTQREKERAVELHELQEADEKRTKSRVEYGNAKREKRGAFARGLEKVTGLEAIEDIVTKESRATFKDNDAHDKEQKKIKEFKKIAKIEKEINAINESINREIKSSKKSEENKIKADFRKHYGFNLSSDQQKVLDEKIKENEEKYNKLYESTVNDAFKESNRMNVSTRFISEAVKTYMANEGISKVKPDDIESILDSVQNKLSENDKKVVISDSAKQKVKQAFEQKMIDDRQGLGFESKDTITAIREALGGKDVLDRTRASRISNQSQNLQDLNKQLLDKLNELNALNDNGKVKYKSTFVSVNKIVKELLKKKGK